MIVCKGMRAKANERDTQEATLAREEREQEYVDTNEDTQGRYPCEGE